MNFEKKLVLFESISLEKTVFLDNLSNWLIWTLNVYVVIFGSKSLKVSV